MFSCLFTPPRVPRMGWTRRRFYFFSRFFSLIGIFRAFLTQWDLGKSQRHVPRKRHAHIQSAKNLQIRPGTERGLRRRHRRRAQYSHAGKWIWFGPEDVCDRIAAKLLFRLFNRTRYRNVSWTFPNAQCYDIFFLFRIKTAALLPNAHCYTVCLTTV